MSGDHCNTSGDSRHSAVTKTHPATVGQGAAARHRNAAHDNCIQTHFFPMILKSDQGVLHTILFVLKMTSSWYQDHLNWNSRNKVMVVLPKSRKTVKCNLGGNLKKEKRYYLVKPNLFLLWRTKISSFLLLGGDFYQI